MFKIISYLFLLYIIAAFTISGAIFIMNRNTIDWNNKATVMLYQNFNGGKILGTGVVINDHTILTANHMTKDGDIFTIKFWDGESTEAKANHNGESNDLATLSFNPSKLKIKLRIASLVCQLPKRGSVIYTIGNPIGIERTFTEGYVSNKHVLPLNTKPDPIIHALFLADISIMPGNSGGGMFEMWNGGLIGIVSRIFEFPVSIIGQGGVQVPLMALTTTRLSQGVRSDEICKFLDKNKIEYKKSGVLIY